MVKSVHILGREIKIVQVSRSELLEKKHGDKDLDEDTVAWFSPYEATIYIWSGLEEEIYRRILLHELTHATLSICGVSATLDDATEEAICWSLENWITLFKNKKFVEGLQD